MKLRKRIYLIIKRFFDVIIGLIGIILLIPITIILKIISICTGDFKSILFTQERIGLNGKRIKIFKYR